MANKTQFFDAIALSAVVSELQSLVEARIDKVGQPSRHELYFNMRSGGQNKRLYVNLRDAWARVHLTDVPQGNMPSPTSFTMLLRKYMEGARLLAVRQPGLERVIELVVAGRDELGDPYERTLVIELIGKFSNMFFLDGRTDLILGCMRPVTEAMCEVRQLGPGLPYDPPPQSEGKVPFDQAGDAALAEALQSPGKLVDALSSRISGVSKVALSQILDSVGIPLGASGLEAEASALARGVALAQEALASGRFCPRLTPGKPWDYALWALHEADCGHSSPSALLDAYYAGRQNAFLLEERRRKIQLGVSDALRKQRARLKEWERSLSASEGATRQRELGDLIMGHMHAITPGMATVTVTDYFDPEAPEYALTLDPQLSASENAQRHFRKYQKLRNSRIALDQLLADGREELHYWEQVEVALAQATELRELEEIADELNPSARPQPQRGKKAEAPRPMKLTSSDGFTIYVGKNNKQNDYLTFKIARSHDLWLHTQIIPGSHVVIVADGPVPERTLHEAAMLAAHFSQARDSSQVPVVYTQRKYVKKPSGAKPGMVIYTHEQTLFVNPGMALGMAPAVGM